jgi:hypothetical protein
MSHTWDVKLGSLWRTYKVQGRRVAPFVKDGTLAARERGLRLETKYDPPGSGWLAAGAALVTGIVVILGAQTLGVCAGPGWLAWFLGIALLRRRPATLNLNEADAVIADPVNRRLAFHLNYEGKPRWVAFEVTQNFDEAARVVAEEMPGRVAEEKIERALTSGSIALIVIAILFAALILVSIVSAFLFIGRTRRVMPTRSMISFLPAIAFLPGLSRRIRCIWG